DIGTQLARRADPGAGIRRNPIVAVLLTDAELDHVTGLLSLREGSDLVVYATGWILRGGGPPPHPPGWWPPRPPPARPRPRGPRRADPTPPRPPSSGTGSRPTRSSRTCRA